MVIQEIPLSDAQIWAPHSIIQKQSFYQFPLSGALAVITHTHGSYVSSTDDGAICHICRWFGVCCIFRFSLQCDVVVCRTCFQLFWGHLTKLVLARCFWKWLLGSTCVGFQWSYHNCTALDEWVAIKFGQREWTMVLNLHPFAAPSSAPALLRWLTLTLVFWETNSPLREFIQEVQVSCGKPFGCLRNNYVIAFCCERVEAVLQLLPLLAFVWTCVSSTRVVVVMTVVGKQFWQVVWCLKLSGCLSGSTNASSFYQSSWSLFRTRPPVYFTPRQLWLTSAPQQPGVQQNSMEE